MGIKRINEIYDAIKNSNFDDLLSEKSIELSSESINELGRMAENAKKIILSSIEEKEFVKMMFMVQKVSVSAGLLEGAKLTSLADQAGELQGYTHTVVLAVIGALIEDEIL